MLVHPVTTNLESPKIAKFLLRSIKRINCQCIWIWPNIDAESDKISNIIRSFREKDKNQTKINFYKNFKLDYLNLIKILSV